MSGMLGDMILNYCEHSLGDVKWGDLLYNKEICKYKENYS